MQSLEPSDTIGEAVERTAELLQDRPFALLTGAGISTDSGIPAYRGAGARHAARGHGAQAAGAGAFTRRATKKLRAPSAHRRAAIGAAPRP